MTDYEQKALSYAEKIGVFEYKVKGQRRQTMTDYEQKALSYAEKVGVIEYKVNGHFIEYWSFYGQSEGWYFVRYDLDAGREVFRGANIPWDGEMQIPAFLKTDAGATLYNYMVG